MMKKIWPVLLTLIVFPFWPFLIWILLHGSFEHLVQALTGPVLPDILGNSRRWFLLSLWLSGTVSVSMLFWLFLRDRDYRYGLGMLGALLLFAGTTWIGMPFGAQEARRWQVEAQRAEAADRDFWISGYQIIRAPWDRSFDAAGLSRLQDRFTQLHRNKPAYPYLPEDLAEVRAELNLPFSAESGTRERKRLRSQLEDALRLIPDQPDLLREYAMTGFEQYDGQPGSMNQAVVDRIRAAIIFAPRDHTVWAAFALFQLLQPCAATCEYQELQLEYAQNLLLMAVWLAEGGDPFDDERLRVWMATLSGDRQQLIQLLLARAREQVAGWMQQAVDPELQAQAARVLPVKVTTNQYSRILLREAKRHVGRVEVDLAAHGLAARDAATSYPYPEIDQPVEKAVALVSLDTDAEGNITYASIAQSSGYPGFDRQALAFTLNWDLSAEEKVLRRQAEATGTPERILVPVNFHSTLLSWDEYYQVTAALAETLARAAARQDEHALKKAEDALRKERKERFPQRIPIKSDYNYLSLLSKSVEASKRLGHTNLQGWKYSIEELKNEVKRLPDQVAPLLDLGRTELTVYKLIGEEMHYDGKLSRQNINDWRQSLLNARQAFLKALLNDPQSADAWFAWGATWVNEDVELTAGALVQAQKLRSSASDLSKTVSRSMFGIGGRVRSLIGDAAEKRLSILQSRMGVIEDDELARTPLPKPAFAGYLPKRTAAKVQRDDSGVSHVNFQAAGIVNRVLPVFPRLDFPPGSAILLLRVDVNADGTAGAAMVVRSSTVQALDQAAVDAAHEWRFRRGPARVVEVPVHFERVVRTEGVN